MYTELLKPAPAVKPPRCIIHFVNGVNVVVPEGPHARYRVRLVDPEKVMPTQMVEVGPAEHVCFPYRFWRPWRVFVEDLEGKVLHKHEFNASNRRVIVSIESKSLGDTLAWLPAAVKFQERHQCEVVVSTFLNDFLKGQYPELTFVEPGSSVANCYATYVLGFYYDDRPGEYSDVPKPTHHLPGAHFREEPMAWVASRSLGVGASEERARLPELSKEGLPEEPYVCIGVHSTAQAKYWNREGGWQEVVDWLKSRNYGVYIASREKSPFMGNKNPKGAKRLPDYDLRTTASWLAGSKAFVGIGSGLSWLAWSAKVPVVLISGFSQPWTEVRAGVWRVNSPPGVCTGCFNRERLNAGDWMWCPQHKGTERAFECSKTITPAMVIRELEKALGKT